MSVMRDVIIATTRDLLETQGLHATGLNQIVKRSGAPKGSLYHYFPAGKDEIAEAAIVGTGHAVAEHIAAALAEPEDAAEAVYSFVMRIAELVEVSKFTSGGPLATVAMETATTNARLNHACRGAYDRLQMAFESKLVDVHYPKAAARDLATFITAAIEGGTILCRTYHSGDPLRLVAAQLRGVLRHAAPNKDQE